VLGNVYSVASRLIGEQLVVRVGSETLELWYAQRRIDTLPRLRGRGRHRIDYRHIIEWLVRKPGAFANYRYREELFPTTRFRMAYDQLCARHPATADRRYLEVLYLAAAEGESQVEGILAALLAAGAVVSAEVVQSRLETDRPACTVGEVAVDPVDLALYDVLLRGAEEAPCPPQS
jgi:hypothetical protein